MSSDELNSCPPSSIGQSEQNGSISQIDCTRAYSRSHAALLSGVGGIVCFCLFMVLASASITISGESHDDEPISPVPLEVPLDQAKVKLGASLFNDSRLSGGNGVSCANCHLFDKGLTDGMPISRGLPGYPGVTNTFTLFNVGLNSKLGWDGHFLTLEEQANAVVQDKHRMGANWDQIVPTLRNDTALTATFNEIYKDGLQRDNIIDALVQYEKSLDTPNAPFDRYLRGDVTAISQEAKDGYQLFKNYGCASCHQGVNVGGNMLQVFGIFGTPEAASLGSKTPGSAQGSGIDDNRPVFRVPPLRNIAQTGPYFHDGSAATLSDAIGIMAKYQLGRPLSDDDLAKIEAFLETLSGEYQGVPVGKL
jgi:cytochrome c peroxidase